jgi:hypothetical protein
MKTLIDARAASDLAVSEYRAIEHPDLADWQRVGEAANVVTRLLGQPTSREVYEAECTRAGLEPWTEEQIRQASYTLRYFDHPQDPREWLAAGLARQRLNGIEAEHREAATAPAMALATCAACGAVIPASQLLNASRQAGVCPECYDRYSD